MATATKSKVVTAVKVVGFVAVAGACAYLVYYGLTYAVQNGTGTSPSKTPVAPTTGAPAATTTHGTPSQAAAPSATAPAATDATGRPAADLTAVTASGASQ